jgi:hypothetical protein
MARAEETTKITEMENNIKRKLSIKNKDFLELHS